MAKQNPEDAAKSVLIGKPIRLLDYDNNIKLVTYLWIAGVGNPSGVDYRHWDQQPDGSPDEDYCDVNEVIGELNLWNLQGTIVDGRWEWNGEGNPTDLNGNLIHNIKAM